MIRPLKIPKTTDCETDYNQRVHPELMTQLLHQAIPVLQSVQWRVTSVGEGVCTSELPLTQASTNQHGTHQAALISLSADYTGGLALATLLTGVPLAGIHRCSDDDSVSLWLASMEVKYRNPSTGNLKASCHIPREMAETIRQRYFSGNRVLVTLPVIFTSNGELVAEAQMKYCAQPSIQLKPTKENPRISPLFKQKLKASARMTAGLRAAAEKPTTRIDAAYERTAAGPHGELLAHRLNTVLPQLKHMVTARTEHIDQTLMTVPGLQQVVLLGVGLDMRPFRLSRKLSDPTFFELDLPEMLEERSRVISEMEDRPTVHRRMIAADFKQKDVSVLLREHPDFDPRVPTVVIYEGCSMYFTEEENRVIMHAVAKCLQHPDSRLWCDVVTKDVVEGRTNQPEIERFLEGMDELGKRFLFGDNCPDALLRQCGFATAETLTVGDHLHSNDPVMATYQFVVAAARRVGTVMSGGKRR